MHFVELSHFKEAMAASPTQSFSPPLSKGALNAITARALSCPLAAAPTTNRVFPLHALWKPTQHNPFPQNCQVRLLHLQSCLPSPKPGTQNSDSRTLNSLSDPDSSTQNSRLKVQNSSNVSTPYSNQEIQSKHADEQNSSPVPLPSQQQILTVPHLRDYIHHLPEHVNPLLHSPYFHPTEGFWLSETDMVAQNTAMDIHDPSSHTQTYFHRAGPRYHVQFTPDEVKAAIVTCGGLCPGLNSVIRELVDALWFQYGVRHIRGIQGGYRGFFSSQTLPLDPQIVNDWHNSGGTKLGTSRGGFNLVKIVDAIENQGFNQVYIIGGDGTMKGAVAIFEEVRKRGLKVSVVGIPKTVDNDVGIIDRSFGFQTAVEKAREAVNAAHVEAESTPNGMGLVKLMGRNAGHIALHATLGSRDVDCCLIPEVPFYMEGSGGLLDFVEQRLVENGHCVLVVAEGAGQELMESSSSAKERDRSGNPMLQDIGLWLGKRLKDWWKSKHPDELFALKYIDPTYMIRAVPSNATDTAYCTLLAHSALHGAMAGYTGFVAGPINGRFCYIPLDLVAQAQHVVDVHNHTWAWVKSVNNQPDFIKLEHKESDSAVTHN